MQANSDTWQLCFYFIILFLYYLFYLFYFSLQIRNKTMFVTPIKFIIYKSTLCRHRSNIMIPRTPNSFVMYMTNIYSQSYIFLSTDIYQLLFMIFYRIITLQNTKQMMIWNHKRVTLVYIFT